MLNTDIRDHKIMGMEEEKRQRILSAAMDEFSKGYKSASTDEIVRQAGISKGLLFHYFGTKKGLYVFLIEYALDQLVHEYAEVINMAQPDPLERIWQMSLLKRDLCGRYPNIFNFLTAAFYSGKDEPTNDFSLRFTALREEIYMALYEKIDESLLREGLDKVMASNIIRWTLNGLSDQMTNDRRPFHEMSAEFDRYLEETKRYLDLLRQLLYR